MEHGGVGGVHLIFPVHPAGGDDADGQLHGLHGPDLHGAGLGAEHHPAVLVKVEGVAPVPGGVALAGVQLVEVIGGQLHLRAVQDREAHGDEDLLDLIQRGVHGVLVAQLVGLAGDGDVQRLGLQPLLQGLFRQDGGLLLDGGLHICPDGVGQLAHDGPLLGGELAHLLQNGGQFSLFAQVLDPEGLQLGGLPSSGDGFQRMLANGFQLFLHCPCSLYYNVAYAVLLGWKASKKRLSSHPWDERRILPRYHPDSRRLRRALVALITEGGPAVSPRRLPGEPNRASAGRLAAGDRPSLGGVSNYFPVHR